LTIHDFGTKVASSCYVVRLSGLFELYIGMPIFCDQAEAHLIWCPSRRTSRQRIYELLASSLLAPTALRTACWHTRAKVAGIF
jgi:hypothetical protein